MSTTAAASKPTLAKQLKEHLQEQQEPFNLSTYLSERRYTQKKLSSDDRNTHFTMNSTKERKEPYRNKQRNLHNRRTLKSLLYKLIAPDNNDKEELPTCHKGVKDQLVSETIDMIEQIAETNWFSTVNKESEFSASPSSSVPQNSPSSKHEKDSVFAGYPQALNLRHFEEQKAIQLRAIF
ncbi:hypothetical protein Ddye_003392 [Dipteronia dyeriana]|uniref:Uncharacterized protein n=1 Tax=Dipteronia dyeriana TaxID=168575 RepID=A0AAD9XSW8_9ROSI|nr:hypothetical protein Ddye_003392 [Dipteronia dyeriana]